MTGAAFTKAANMMSTSADVVHTPVPAQLDRVLIVDSNLELQHSRSLLLSSLGLPVDMAAGVSDVFRLSRKIRYHLVVINGIRSDGQAATIAECVRTRWPTARVLLLGESCGVLDDWLYDDLIDPGNGPAGVVQSAQAMLDWARTGVRKR
jgi:hypothetical protein